MEELDGSTVICETAEDTMAFGERIAGLLRPDCSLALIGDMGSGKTTFVRGLARGFAVEENVSSPSFNIVHAYRGNVLLLHVDAYRLDGSRRARDALLLEDFCTTPHCLVVEWPALLHGFLETCDHRIFLAIGDDFSRKITVKNNDESL